MPVEIFRGDCRADVRSSRLRDTMWQPYPRVNHTAVSGLGGRHTIRVTPAGLGRPISEANKSGRTV